MNRIEMCTFAISSTKRRLKCPSCVHAQCVRSIIMQRPLCSCQCSTYQCSNYRMRWVCILDEKDTISVCTWIWKPCSEQLKTHLNTTSTISLFFISTDHSTHRWHIYITWKHYSLSAWVGYSSFMFRWTGEYYEENLRTYYHPPSPSSGMQIATTNTCPW